MVEQFDEDEQQLQLDSTHPAAAFPLRAERHCRKYRRPIK